MATQLNLHASNTTKQYANVFEELIAISGGTPEPQPPQLLEGQALTYLSQKREVNQYLAQHEEQQDLDRCKLVLDPAILQTRVGKLRESTAVLQGVVANKQELLFRLQSNNTKPTIPINVEDQAAFAELLRSAAVGLSQRQRHQACLNWAVDFREAPANWEQYLLDLYGAVQKSKDFHGKLAAYREALLTLAERFNVQVSTADMAESI